MAADQDSEPPPSSPVMTVLEVSAYLKINRTTLYRMARAGSIPCFRIGSAFRFDREAIDQWRLGEETQRRPVPEDAKQRGPKRGKK